MNKKLVYVCLTIALLLVQQTVKAQVTIGDSEPPRAGAVLDLRRTNATGTMGGLLLPHVNITNVELIPGDFTDASVQNQDDVPHLAGTVVYNTNTTTGVGLYIWDGERWKQLNSLGGLRTTDNCQDTPVGKDGGTVSCAVTDPDCSLAGEYRFEIVSGKDFVSLDVTDAGQGKFRLSFNASDAATSRSAIVMVISPCGNSNMFVFTQDGDATGCGTTTVPAIKSQNPGGSFVMCPGGAVFLYLDTFPTTGTFIWTLNGQVVSSGNSFTATQAGRYIVYGDKTGCTNKQEVQVTMGSTTAPSPVQYIVVGNNGEACGAGGTVQLIVSSPVSGTVAWYKDGVKQTSQTGTQISAGKGYWQAVVDDGTCSSLPTAGVNVTENLAGGSITPPVMKINGVLTGWSLCEGGSLFLEVATIEPGITYTWYADNTEIGRGTGVYYPVPSSSQVVIRLRATGTGCAKEAISVNTISVSQAPSAPVINVNTGNVLCGGRATLTASVPAGTASYRWFRDGHEITGETTNTITVAQTGSYTASAITSGGCTSVQSGARTITASDFGTLSWVNHPTVVNEGDTRTYSVNLDFVQGATYTWAVTNGTITNGQGTTSVTVNFPVAGAATVTCTATNGCGTVTGSPLSETVIVGTNCTSAQITATENLNTSIKINGSTIMSVTATGNPRTYQWYTGTVGSGTTVSGATNTSYTYTGLAVGTYSFYCVVSVPAPCTSAISAQFTVTVTADPSAIPTGSGSFSGRNCFDIAYSNDNQNSCAPLSSRTSQRTDFANTTTGATNPYSGTQVYTFTPSGTVSKVRFDYIDASGQVIQSITPNGNYSGNNISTPCLVTVVYKPSLNDDLKGLTRSNALKADLYAIYNDNATGTGTERSIKLTATLSDCACCGAATQTGGWLTFMCHNLGANEGLDPFTYVAGNADGSGGTLGYLYQWGRRSDGHEKRNSLTTATLATNNEATAPAAVAGRFITTSASPYDWRSGGGQTSRWGNGTTALDQPKAANDPCPAGWKVPSQAQWGSIFRGGTTSGAPSTGTANTWTWTGNGYKIGSSLYLPAAGYRYIDASLGHVGSFGYYWSSTVNRTGSYALYFFSGSVGPADTSPTVETASRCVVSQNNPSI